jgi:aquaporin Z
MERGRIFTAEAIGTAILMLGGVGSAVLAGQFIGALGVSLAFGLTLLAMASVIGPVSGCHINPAVTLGMVAARKLPVSELPVYLGAQFLGALAGGAVLLAVASGRPGFSASEGFGANGWDELSPAGFGLGAVLTAEVVFTAVFVLAVLSTTRRGFPTGLGPVVAGLSLALVHLVTIPVSNTSVNPARSLGAAVFQGGDALVQVWAFLLAPLAGGVLAAIIWRLVQPDEEPLGSTAAPDPALTDPRS